MYRPARTFPRFFARAAAALRREAGFTIIEVLVAALLVAMTATGVLSAIDTAVRQTDTNKSRNVAANLAQTDLERLRGMSHDDLVALTDDGPVSRSESVDGEAYTVESQVEWVAGAGGATSCTSADAGARYLRLTSAIAWPGIEPLDPLTSTTLKAIDNATATGRGDLAVTITDRTGAAGVAGIAVSIAGPESETQITNENGCVFFDFIPVGDYTLTFDRPGWIESVLPNRQAIEDTVGVGSGQTATKAYQYDEAGGIRVRFRTRRPGGSSDITTTGDGFTVSNASLGAPPTKSFSGTAASELTTGLVLFPFTGDYTLWAGTCEAAKPSAFGQTNPTVQVTPGATSATVDVWAPTMKITVKDGSSKIGGAKVVVTAAAGCTAATRYEAVTPSSGSDTGIVYFALPYGDYTVCSQNKVTSPTKRKSELRQNRTRIGSPYDSNLASGSTPC